MNGSRVWGTIILSLALALAGCTSLDKKDQGAGASIEDRGISSGEMSDIDAAKSRGLDDGAGYGASALDDPNSPLAVRVVYFDYDSSSIRADFESVVQAHAGYLASNPNASVTLEGHADERGSREYNLALGERRALAVRRQLVLLGAQAGQIRTVSYGEERPVSDGHDESAYALNRRVELVYP